jgi:putative membrane protein
MTGSFLDFLKISSGRVFMNRYLIFTVLTILTALGLAACAGESGNKPANNTRANTGNTSVVNTISNAASTAVNAVSNTVSGKPTEADFWNKAAEGGMAEVELSKLAQSKATNADVKKFAQKMVTDHTKANGELKTLAGKFNVTLPAELNSTHKSALEKLKGLSGADFDKAYVDAMVGDHNDAVSLFQSEADGTTEELKAWAAKTLPTLKEHQRMIKDIQSKMK